MATPYILKFKIIKKTATNFLTGQAKRLNRQ